MKLNPILLNHSASIGPAEKSVGSPFGNPAVRFAGLKKLMKPESAWR